MSSNHSEHWNRYKVREVINNYFCGHSPTCEERPIANELEWGILKTTSITWSGWDEVEHKVPPSKYWGNHNAPSLFRVGYGHQLSI